MDIHDLLDQFNNNELDVEKYFNDIETWFKILKKRGLMDRIDPKYGVGSEHWQNSYLLWLYGENKEKFYEWVKEFLGDIEFDDSGNVYYVTSDRSDLSKLFCDNRNGFSQKTIESILSSEDSFDFYDISADNIYEEIIEQLNKNNLEVLKKRFIEESSDLEIFPETEVLEELLESENPDGDYVKITPNNIDKILNDEESTNYILTNYLTDIMSDLSIIYSTSYNSAYETQVWKEIDGELQDYFEGTGEYVYKPHPFKKDTTVETFKIKVRDFDKLILDFLNENKNYTETLEYYGYLIDVMTNSLPCLSVWDPGYPDSRELEKNINEYFPDYF